MNHRIVPGLFTILLSAVAAVAQAPVMSVPLGVLSGGSSINITYSNPAKPNTTVAIEIDDGAFPTPHKITIQVALNNNGEGLLVWRVPGTWSMALFNAPGVPEQARMIQ